MQLNMTITVIPITDETLGTVSKNLEKRLDELEVSGRIETIQTTALLKSARVFFLKSPAESCCHSDSSELISVRAGQKSRTEL